MQQPFTIFLLQCGLRIFERFGFDLPPGQRETRGAQVVSKFYEWVFDLRYFDWMNVDNELTLTGYVPLVALVNLLRYNVDKEVE